MGSEARLAVSLLTRRADSGVRIAELGRPAGIEGSVNNLGLAAVEAGAELIDTARKRAGV
jgi:hypothetical protein